MESARSTSDVEQDMLAKSLLEPRHAKPMLTVEQQIAHLKSKGVTFDLCSEGDAAAYLAEKCQFFKVTAYRKLFDKCVGGDNDGCYVNLDFGHLQYVAGLDRRLRDVLLSMTLDIEHFQCAALLHQAEERDEDGYQIMCDYREGVSPSRRRYIENELDARSNDAYCGAVIRKYRGDMPIWAFAEVVSFGTFIGLMKFCADRWGDCDLLANQYLIKKAKSVRNASAHSQCILNDLNDGAAQPERVSPVVTRAVASCGIPKRLRAKKLRSPRMAQIATTFYLYDKTVPQGSTRKARAASLESLFAFVDRNAHVLPESNPAVSAVSFIRRLTVGLNLLD